MSTVIQLVNKMQRKLREDQTTSVSSTQYAQLLGEFLDEAKQEIEAAWDWLALRTTIRITTAADQFKYDLVNMGDRGRILPDLLKGPPWMDVWNDTEDYQLRLAPSSQWMTAQHLNESGTTNSQPFWFDINGQTTGGDPQIDFYPTPDAIYKINVNIIQTQGDIEVNDTTDDNSELAVPDVLLFSRAMALAREERGEDPQKYQEQYERLLNDLTNQERGYLQGGSNRGQVLEC